MLGSNWNVKLGVGKGRGGDAVEEPYCVPKGAPELQKLSDSGPT